MRLWLYDNEFMSKLHSILHSLFLSSIELAVLPAGRELKGESTI